MITHKVYFNFKGIVSRSLQDLKEDLPAKLSELILRFCLEHRLKKKKKIQLELCYALYHINNLNCICPVTGGSPPEKAIVQKKLTSGSWQSANHGDRPE